MAKGHRQERLGEEIRKVISELLLSGLKDPRLSGMISITSVDVTRDGSYANIYISVLGTDNDEDKQEIQDETIEAFNSAKSFIRKEISKEIKLRHTPELIFKIDSSVDYGRHIDEIIEKLNKEGK